MPDTPINVNNQWARYIFNQWQQIPITNYTAPELYKCCECYNRELAFERNSETSFEDLGGFLNCHPGHKNGIQAYLAADATPSLGGIAFFTQTGQQAIYCYQPDFLEMGLDVNLAQPTEFEMINLLFALFIFKQDILNHKTVRIIVDNNFMRERGKRQRHALTEAVAAILEWCDGYGCTINELFSSNEPGDQPFLKVADELARSRPIDGVHKVVPASRRNFITPGVLSAINGILSLENELEGPVPRSSTRRLKQMLSSFHTVPATESFADVNATVSKPIESKWFWTKIIFICVVGVFVCVKTFGAK